MNVVSSEYLDLKVMNSHQSSFINRAIRSHMGSMNIETVCTIQNWKEIANGTDLVLVIKRAWTGVTQISKE